jgi:hypothetical protein
MASVQQVGQTFVVSVLPALFPMMVLGGLFDPAQTKQGKQALLVLFGFCAGSPASARQAALLHKRCPIPRKRWMPLLCMGGVMSPMFFVGSLAGRLGQQAGWLLLAAHWLSALATGMVCTGFYRCKAEDDPPSAAKSPAAPPPEPSGKGLSAAMPAAVTAAAQALLSVLGAMMAFGIVAAVLRGIAERLFPAWTAAHPSTLACLWALLEIGGGIFSLMEHAPPLWAVCALCSFGGLSIWLQNLLFLGKTTNPMELLVWRMLHGGLGGLCCYLLQQLCPAAVPTAAQTAGAMVAPGSLLPILLLVTLAFPGRRRAS